MEEVRVLIADDEALVRHGLRVFLDSDPRTTVVGEASDGRRAVQLSEELAPDVVLMDIQMPGMSGIEATEEVCKRSPTSKVLTVTTFSSERHVVSALRAGASGYLVKDTTPESIIRSVIDVHQGRSVLSPQIARELISAVQHAHTPNSRVSAADGLTDRELSVVQLLAAGRSNSEIAEQLHVSEATVKACFSRIMSKWAVRDRVQVLIHAAREGIVRL